MSEAIRTGKTLTAGFLFVLVLILKEQVFPENIPLFNPNLQQIQDRAFFP